MFLRPFLPDYMVKQITLLLLFYTENRKVFYIYFLSFVFPPPPFFGLKCTCWAFAPVVSVDMRKKKKAALSGLHYTISVTAYKPSERKISIAKPLAMLDLGTLRGFLKPKGNEDPDEIRLFTLINVSTNHFTTQHAFHHFVIWSQANPSKWIKHFITICRATLFFSCIIFLYYPNISLIFLLEWTHGFLLCWSGVTNI